jgi:hypothetical protein
VRLPQHRVQRRIRRQDRRWIGPTSTIGYRPADSIPQPISGSANSSAYIVTSDASATTRSNAGTVGGNGGARVSSRLANRNGTSTRIATPIGRWIATSAW